MISNERIKQLQKDCDDVRYNEMTMILSELLHHRDQSRWRDATQEKPNHMATVIGVTNVVRAEWCLVFYKSHMDLFYDIKNHDVVDVVEWRPMFDLPPQEQGGGK